MLSLFSSYAESEVQTYYFIFFIIFTVFSLLYWLSFKRRFSSLPFLNDNSKIKLNKLFFFFLLVIQIAYLVFFVIEGYRNPVFVWELNETGFFPENNFKLTTFIIISLLLIFSYFFLIFNKSFEKKAGIVFYILSFLSIAILTLNFEKLNFYDYAYYAGPINDILHGKYLLYNSISQYGFLSIIFLSIPFYFVKLNLTNLTILNSVAIIGGFTALLAIAQFLYKNKYYALFVLIFIIFANHITAGHGYYLQTNALRFGMWMLICLSIINEVKNSHSKFSKVWEAITLLLISVSVFWIFDNGIYVLLAYFSYKIFDSLQEDAKNTFSIIKKTLLKLAVSVGVVFLLINGFYIFILNINPNWSYYISDSVYYLHGYGLMIFPNSSWPWFFILTYAVSLCLLFTQRKFNFGKDKLSENRVFSFIVFYGIFQFTYFVGRSHLNNLHHVFVPFSLSLFYIILIIIQYTKSLSDIKIKIITGIIISLALALPSYFLFLPGIKNIKYENLFHIPELIRSANVSERVHLNSILGKKTVSKLKSNSNNKYGQYIKSYGITILSIFDTWYLIELNSVNNVESNNLQHYTDERDLKNLARSVVNRGDKYIFVDKDKTREGKIVYYLLKTMVNDYKFKENIGELDVYEKITP